MPPKTVIPTSCEIPDQIYFFPHPAYNTCNAYNPRGLNAIGPSNAILFVTSPILALYRVHRKGNRRRESFFIHPLRTIRRIRSLDWGDWITFCWWDPCTVSWRVPWNREVLWKNRRPLEQVQISPRSGPKKCPISRTGNPEGSPRGSPLPWVKMVWRTAIAGRFQISDNRSTRPQSQKSDWFSSIWELSVFRTWQRQAGLHWLLKRFPRPKDNIWY